MHVALVTADLESRLVAVAIPSGRVLRHIPTLAYPRSIQRVGTAAVVAHSDIGAVTVVDGQTLRVAHVLRGFDEPRYTIGHPDGRHAYVTDAGRGDVAVARPADRTRARARERGSAGASHHDRRCGSHALDRARQQGRGDRRRGRVGPRAASARAPLPAAVPRPRRRLRARRAPRLGQRRGHVPARRLRHGRVTSFAGRTATSRRSTSRSRAGLRSSPAAGAARCASTAPTAARSLARACPWARTTCRPTSAGS